MESLLAIKQLHDRYGHIQEVIIQNFRAKTDTKMANSPEPNIEELLWTVAVARLIFGTSVSVQVPPNLNGGALGKIVDAGINDFGGISPVTPDHVNPELPWPHLKWLRQFLRNAGFILQERLTVYPTYATNSREWMDDNITPVLLQLMDGEGLAREDDWRSGGCEPSKFALSNAPVTRFIFGTQYSKVHAVLDKIKASGVDNVSEKDLSHLFGARSEEFTQVCLVADEIRNRVSNDRVSYVVNCNINYTNICIYKCQFCAFSKSSRRTGNTEAAYNMTLRDIQQRVLYAESKGATEVCLQGGIHPSYTGQTYLNICTAIKTVAPNIHIHAFSPLEVYHGARTLNLSVQKFLEELKQSGLSSLPGTAAEILDDNVRATLCQDKVTTQEWLDVMAAAHNAGLTSTATIMFGHVDNYQHWIRHLKRIRQLQKQTGGFTEFVPLPFVAKFAPIYKRGQARPGPTYREAVLMHAVARIVLHPHIQNIQASWVKMGEQGVKDCLKAGANDMGGTLMTETITRAAGAVHGQNVSEEDFEQWAYDVNRCPMERTSNYSLFNRPRGIDEVAN